MPVLGISELLVFIPNLGPMELVIILVIVLVIFGSSKLPTLGKGLGEGIKNFKKGIKDSDDTTDASSENGEAN
jgi:sec-independent protein translocase protein TatA